MICSDDFQDNLRLGLVPDKVCAVLQQTTSISVRLFPHSLPHCNTNIDEPYQPGENPVDDLAVRRIGSKAQAQTTIDDTKRDDQTSEPYMHCRPTSWVGRGLVQAMM